MTSKAETLYVRDLMPRIEQRLPGCMIIKNDPRDLQGISDLLVLYGPFWAMLEAKASETSPVRPNQPYYVDKFNNMSFAAFIYPENEEEVLNALQSACGLRR